jgi:hypothetical protein
MIIVAYGWGALSSMISFEYNLKSLHFKPFLLTILLDPSMLPLDTTMAFFHKGFGVD